jgi:hypothetical protein
MAVGRKDEFYIKTPALGISFGLIETVSGRQSFLFGFNEREGDGLGVPVYSDPQDIVNLTPGAASGPAANDFDGAGGFLAPDQVLGPVAPADARINQFGSGICFV